MEGLHPESLLGYLLLAVSRSRRLLWAFAALHGFREREVLSRLWDAAKHQYTIMYYDMLQHSMTY